MVDKIFNTEINFIYGSLAELNEIIPLLKTEYLKNTFECKLTYHDKQRCNFLVNCAYHVYYTTFKPSEISYQYLIKNVDKGILHLILEIPKIKTIKIVDAPCFRYYEFRNGVPYERIYSVNDMIFPNLGLMYNYIKRMSKTHQLAIFSFEKQIANGVNLRHVIIE